MSANETPASLLLQDANINLQISDYLSSSPPHAPFQHEVYFQAFYAVEKAVKAVCDVYGIATVITKDSAKEWNDKIKIHNINKLLWQLKQHKNHPRYDDKIIGKIADAAKYFSFDPEDRYPDINTETIPSEKELYTTESVNNAREYARQFVSEIEKWVKVSI